MTSKKSAYKQKGMSEKPKQKVCQMYLVCDSCGHYPIKPVHGHYVCPACYMPTKCCEGMPLEI